MAGLIIGISGSPRKEGNNDKIIDYALDKFSEKGYSVKPIKLSHSKVHPCIACDYCKEHKKCFQDDYGNEANELLAKSLAVIISSPVYFGGMSAQLKALFDRTRPLRGNGFLLQGKPLAAVSVGASRNGGQELTIKDIHAWGLIHGMVVVGDKNHFGGIVKAPFLEDKFGKQTVDDTVRSVDSLLKRLKDE